MARLLQAASAVFHERHLYLRSGGEMRSFRLTARHQAIAAGAVAAVVGWCLLSTGALITESLFGSTAQAAAEPMTVVRTAVLTNGGVVARRVNGADALARAVENRHEALVEVLGDLRDVPGAARALAPANLDATAPLTPEQRLNRVRADQERMLSAAEELARSRSERVRGAFRAAGLNPSDMTRAGQGGPFIAIDDPRAVAALSTNDPAFARRLARLSANLTEMRRLTDAAETAPFGRPVMDARRTSGFGGRSDPINGSAAFHAGVDFAGAMRTPILATAAGVVSFVGTRSGYGNVVEVDHGHGLRTRYAHLSAALVSVGQRVALGERIAAMGNTGRSTGTHLHYEVLVDERPQNPDRFLGAGDLVREVRAG